MFKKEFKISFNWIDKYTAAFKYIKDVVSSTSVLHYYNFDKKAIVEVDSSDYVYGGVILQYDEDGVLYFVVFFSRKLTSAEYNYEIYNKELLVIVSVFEHWRSELKRTENFIEVFTDYKTLEYFMTIKKLIRRQVKWALDFSNFNFKI